MMQDWSPRGDPILALLPAERPPAFDALPFEEQQWRAKVYLATWIFSGSNPYSWAQALKRDIPPDEEAWAKGALTYDVLVEGLASVRQQAEPTA